MQRRIFHDAKYDFIRWWRTTTGLTVAFIVAGLVAMAIHGIVYSIEFTGGTLMQLRFRQDANIADIRTALRNGGVRGEELQSFGSNREFTIRVQDEGGELGAGAEGQ